MSIMFRAVLLAAAITAPALAQNERAIVDTTLERLRESPEAYKNVRVRFPMQFCSVGRVSNPFFTRFVPSDFANFYGWSVEQPIWRREAYSDLFGLCFVSKRLEQTLDDLYALKLYDRVYVVGTVQNVFQRQPWINVEKLQPMSSKTSTVTLSHLFRGEKHMDRREWRQAITELSMAPGDTTPNEVLSAVAHNLGVCYLRLGEAQPALRNLERAAYLNPNAIDTERLLAQVRQRPDVGLDRQVDATRVRDFERPLWEAFEEEELETAVPIR